MKHLLNQFQALTKEEKLAFMKEVGLYMPHLKHGV